MGINCYFRKYVPISMYCKKKKVNQRQNKQGSNPTYTKVLNITEQTVQDKTVVFQGKKKQFLLGRFPIYG